MKKLTTLSAITLLLVIGFSSCSKDQDELDREKPVLTLQKTGSDTLNGGDTLFIQALATDNEGLSQVKFSIHNDFDLHTHGKNEATVFEWDTILNLSGLSADINFFIVIPKDLTSGPYHLLGMLLDQQGNEADLADRDLFFYNAYDSQAPEINNLFTTPAISNDEIEIVTGDTLYITASLSDDQALHDLEILLIKESDGSTVYDHEVELTGTSYTLNHSIPMLASYAAGEYELILVLKDEKGNRTLKEIHLHLEP